MGQNLTTGQCDGFPGPLVESTWPVQALMAQWQSGTTRADSLSVGQVLKDMKMRFVLLCQLGFVLVPMTGPIALYVTILHCH